MRKQVIIMAAVALMAVSGGYFVAMVLSPGPAQQMYSPAGNAAASQVEDMLGQRRPDFELGDLNGAIVSAADFDGKVLLLNFWATWCKPCTEEMPMLSQLQENYAGNGVQILGIALDDPQKARAFASKLAIRYPILVGTVDTILAGRQYGNRDGMLPYSVLVDTNGIVRWAYLGALDKEELEVQIRALL